MESAAFCAAHAKCSANLLRRVEMLAMAYKTGRSASSFYFFITTLPVCFYQKEQYGVYMSPRTRSLHSKTLPSIPILCRPFQNLFASYQNSKDGHLCWFLAFSLFFPKPQCPGLMIECAGFVLLPRSLHKKSL